MPGRYNYVEDGKIHTRFSELENCTPGKILNAMEMRFKGKDIPQTGPVTFGVMRHEMFAEESKKTNKFPQSIIDRYKFLDKVVVDMVEEELVTEIFDGIVLHSTPDAVSTQALLVADYKTTTKREAADYAKSMQNKVYAYQLRLRGIKIKEISYICEHWNPERTEFEKYSMYLDKISLLEISQTRTWLQKRCEMLKAAIKAYESGLLN